MRLSLMVAFFISVLAFSVLANDGDKSSRLQPNLLIITVDDMSADSLGVYGCTLKDTSPSIDGFAKTAMRFDHAHVQVGNCMPGRNVMWSGMYSHRNGVEGFVQNPKPNYPVLCDLAQSAGYFAAIRGKVSHSTPYIPYRWDAVLDNDSEGKRYHVKDPLSYGDATKQGIELARAAGKPFCLMVNISDPHKPFYNPQTKNGKPVDAFIPSRVFGPDEVPVPGFLFEDPVVREELSLYYSSVRRADDAFRSIHQALIESGNLDNTVVMFCSDHGMPLPFAKTQLYYHSTRTPLMIRWPGVTTAGYVDREHMVSSIDFLPTILEIIGSVHPEPDRLQGRSFAPLLRGEQQANRDHVVLQYNENSGGNRHPMRGIQTKDSLYLFNPWSNGDRKFATATTGTATYRRLRELAAENAFLARRLKQFDHRELQELYDVKNDPNCLTNLMGYTEHRDTLSGLRATLASDLQKIGDPVAPLLAADPSSEKIVDFMAEQDQRALERQKKRRESRSKKKAVSNKLSENALGLQCDSFVLRGKEVQTVVSYDIPKRLGEQILHVTLRQAGNTRSASVPERIHRTVESISGSGSIVLSFMIPDDPELSRVSFAAFIGSTYPENIIHKVTDSIEVRD